MLKAAMQAWDRASPLRDDVFDETMRIRTALRDTTSHRAYGWAAVTCGRIAAHRKQIDLEKVLLPEALGRFSFVGDAYGENMAISYLALPHVFWRNLDRTWELSLRPLTSSLTFSDEDSFLMHNNVSQCYWAREESYPAILHLMKASDRVSATDDFDRQSIVLGNIAVVLETLGEWDLALSVSTKAWRLQFTYCSDHRKIQLTYLANMVFLNYQLEKYEAAVRDAELLLDYVNSGHNPATSNMYLSLANAFALGGQIEKAEHCLGRAREVNQIDPTTYLKSMTQVSAANFLAAKKDHVAAAALAKELLQQPAATVTHTNHRYAAKVLSRSYAALGRKAESEKWRQFANESGREKLLGNILTSQLRASLKVEQPVTLLTQQELACLSLSAHGQTSADIALKLGIKMRTVNFHITKVLRKLNATNRQEAIAKAESANLLQSL